MLTSCRKLIDLKSSAWAEILRGRGKGDRMRAEIDRRIFRVPSETPTVAAAAGCSKDKRTKSVGNGIERVDIDRVDKGHTVPLIAAEEVAWIATKGQRLPSPERDGAGTYGVDQGGRISRGIEEKKHPLRRINATGHQEDGELGKPDRRAGHHGNRAARAWT
jgi:hypothetical protein